MRRAFAMAVILSWASAGVALADPPTASVPIEPAPTPIAPAPVAAPMPDAHSLSRIDPTAGPVVPPKKVLKPSPKTPAHPAVASSGAEQRREVAALNDLAAAGYGQFRDVHRVGRDYQATVDDPHGSYVVTVDPESGRIAPAD